MLLSRKTSTKFSTPNRSFEKHFPVNRLSLWLYKLRVGMQKVSTDGCFIGIKLRAFQLKVGDMIPEDSLGLWPWSAAHNSETSLKENERRDDFSVFKWTVGRLVA